MIGTYNSLVKAANGQFPIKTIPEPQPIIPDGLYGFSTPYYEAIQRRIASSQTPDQRVTSSNLIGAVQQPATETYKTLMGNVTRPTGGLSSKGKYGGFYSAGDLQTAIEGAAKNFATQVPYYLRSQAANRYNELDKMYAAAQPKNLVDRRLMGNFRRGEGSSAESVGRFMASPDLRRQYAETLGGWYAQNAAPAEDYLTTAQQIESEPISNLAASIATQTYGMNPDLARGKFAGLDKTFFEEQRNAQYMQQYGMPYEKYTWLESQNTSAARAAAKQQIAAIESSTGLNIGQIRDYSGMNDSAMYNALNMNDVQYEDSDGNVQQITAKDAIDQSLQMFQDGKQDDLNNFVNMISDVEGQTDIANLIKAIISLQARKITRNEGYTSDYFLSQP